MKKLCLILNLASSTFALCNLQTQFDLPQFNPVPPHAHNAMHCEHVAYVLVLVAVAIAGSLYAHCAPTLSTSDTYSAVGAFLQKKAAAKTDLYEVNGWQRLCKDWEKQDQKTRAKAEGFLCNFTDDSVEYEAFKTFYDWRLSSIKHSSEFR